MIFSLTLVKAESTIADSVLHMVTAPKNVNIFDLTIFGMDEKPW